MIPRDVYVHLGFKDGAEFDSFFAAENKEHATDRLEMIIRTDLIRRAVDGETLDMRAELVRQRKIMATENVRPFSR